MNLQHIYHPIKKSITVFLIESKMMRFFYPIISGIILTDVPIDKIRCQVSPFSELQGFSGKPIEHFPPYNFFKIALSDLNKGYDDFHKWMYKCLVEKEAWKIPKSDGGWANGSLMKIILDEHYKNGIKLKDINNAEMHLVEKAIKKRVNYYIQQLFSIKQKGFNNSIYPPIRCYIRDDLYLLAGGHHRVSILRALGYEFVKVKVYKGK